VHLSPIKRYSWPFSGRALTSMLTLAILIKEGLLRQWQPTGGRMMMRGFYYSRPWQEARNALPSVLPRRQVKWWDDDAQAEGGNDQAGEAGPDIDLAAMDLSIRGGLDGFVETFVAGWSRVRLIRKQGFGMDPPFKRMHAPREAVVEMSTEHTRTFGFFVREAVFVAHRLDLAKHTHGDPRLYAQYGDDVLKLLRRMSSTEKDESSDVESLIGSCDQNE